jgi:hypothetical protein
VTTTHGGLDDDYAVQEAVIRHIKGPAFTGRVQRPTQVAPRSSDPGAASNEPESMEAEVIAWVVRKGRTPRSRR